MKTDELEKLAALRDKGILTPEEFEAEKKKILEKDDDVISRTRFEDDDGDEIQVTLKSRVSPRAKTPGAVPVKKNVFDRYADCIKKYCVLRGRASRAEYWGCVFVNFLTSFALAFVDALANFQGILYGLYSLFMFLPLLAVAVRRFHDTNHSGRWVGAPLFAGIAIGIYAGIAVAVSAPSPVVLSGFGLFFFGVAAYSFYLMVKKGDAGANRYGKPVF